MRMDVLFYLGEAARPDLKKKKYRVSKIRIECFGGSEGLRTMAMSS